MKFRTMRQHLGDRMYMPGDTREAAAADVAVLVKSGVLLPLEDEAVKVAPKKKAHSGAPENK